MPSLRLTNSNELWIPCALWAVGLLFFLFLRHETLGRGESMPLPWDTGWYANIAEHGYVFHGDPFTQSNTAFMPLYPYSVRLFKFLTGMSTVSSMLFVSALYTLFAVLYFYSILRTYGDAHTAAISVALFLFFPYSFYMWNGYAESCFVFFAMGFFHSRFVRDRDEASALWASFSVLAKQVGIVLIGFYLADLILRAAVYKRRNPIFFRQTILTIFRTFPFLFLGLGILTVYFYLRFEDPLLFIHTLNAWTWTEPSLLFDLPDFAERIFRGFYTLYHVGRQMDDPVSFAHGLGLVACAMVLCEVLRRPSRFAALYSLGFWSYLFLFHPGTPNMDLGRYLVLFFPFFLAVPSLMHWCIGRVKIIYWVGLAGLLLFCVHFYASFVTLFYLGKWVS